MEEDRLTMDVDVDIDLREIATPTDRSFAATAVGSTQGLQPCKIRRNYLCKECDYATVNPRDYLYHQRDAHAHKGSIHECPYCVYASPHSHKLNRHVTIIHHPARSLASSFPVSPSPSMSTLLAVLTGGSSTIDEPGRRQRRRRGARMRREINSTSPVRTTTSSKRPSNFPKFRSTHERDDDSTQDDLRGMFSLSSPPSLKRQVPFSASARLGSAGSSPEMEVILLEEEEEEDEEAAEIDQQRSDHSKRTTTTVRQLVMQANASASTADVNLFPPMPKLVPISALPPPPPPPSSSTTSSRGNQKIANRRRAAKLSLLHKEYSCSLCSFRSRSVIVVQQHEKVFHPRKRFFRCGKCNYVTNVRSRYTKHVRYHTMPYIGCHLCDFSTPYKWNLARHLRYHNGRAATGVAAIQDEAGTGTENEAHAASKRESLSAHVPLDDRDHDDEDGEAEVTEIEFQDGQGSSLGKRLEAEQEQREAYEMGSEDDSSRNKRTEYFDAEMKLEMTDDDDDCRSAEIDEEKTEREDCVEFDGPESTATKEASTSASASASASAAGSGFDSSCIYTCGECEDRFSSVPLLDRHMYECHDIDNPRIPSKRANPNSAAQRGDDQRGVGMVQCDVCSYKAKWVSEMVKHRRVHTMDKPYACVHCKFRTRWKGDMTRHTMRYHPDKYAPPPPPTTTTTSSSSSSKPATEAVPISPAGSVLARALGSVSPSAFASRSTLAVALASSLPAVLSPTSEPLPTVPPSTTENIDSLLDQSMTVGGEGEFCFWSSGEDGVDGETEEIASKQRVGRCEQETPLDLSLAAGGCQLDEDDNDDDDGHNVRLRSYVDPNRDTTPINNNNNNSIRLSGGKIVHKKYQCPNCDFVTPTPSRFHMHIVAHLNPKPYMCSECGYRSNWQWDITKHSKMKSIRDRAHLSASVVCVNEYGSTNYERYEQYAVYDTKNVNSSGGDATGGINCSPEDRPLDASTTTTLSEPQIVQRRVTYKCRHCDFKNAVKKMVVRHMVIHSAARKQKRFCCGICGHASHWKYIVLRHCHNVHGTSGPIMLKDSSPASPPTSDDVDRATSKKGGGGGGDEGSDDGGELGSTPTIRADDDDDVDKDIIESVPDEITVLDQRSKDDANVTGPDASPTKDKRHRCSICPYRCRKMFDLRIHSYLHRPREGAIFKCFFCPFYVSLKRSWLNHMRLHVDQPMDYAKHVFGDKADAAISGQLLDPIFAGTASIRGDNESESESKLDDNDNDNEDNNDGDDVYGGGGGGGDLVTDPAGVPRVWVNRGGVVEKMFKCRHCPHVSKKRAVIVTHEQMHRKRQVDAGKLTHKCPHCNYSALNAGVLTSHMKVHQQRANDAMRSLVAAGSSESASTVAASASTTTMSVSTTLEDGRLKMRIKKTTSSDFGVNSSQNNGLRGGGGGGGGNHPAVLHSCSECPAKFTKLAQMLNHRTFHGAALPWHCNHCSYAAKHRPHLHKHERVHTAEYLRNFRPTAPPPPQPPPPPPPPPHPRLIRPSKDDKDEDFDSSLAIDDTNLEPVDYDNPWRARERMSSSQISPSSLAAAAAKPTLERKYRCDMCPAVFLKYSTLVYHLHLHNNNDGKHRCSHCTYSVSNVGNLARHSKIHEKASMNAARVHRSPTIVSSGGGGERRKSPFDPAAVNLIMAARSPPPPPSANTVHTDLGATKHRSKGRFACAKCPATFDKQARYKVHLNLHGGDHRFHCDKCDYAVKFAAILIRHKALHDTDDRPPPPPRKSAAEIIDDDNVEEEENDDDPASIKNFAASSPMLHQVLAGNRRHEPSKTVASGFASAAISAYDRMTAAVSSSSSSSSSSLTTTTRRPPPPTTTCFDVGGTERSSMPVELRQHLLLQTLQNSKPVSVPMSVEVETARPGVVGVGDCQAAKRVFCCDRCPYVHQRKDAVQSHLKRHGCNQGASSSRDLSSASAFCPHCDYGTSIHSFLRDHMKLHFRPSTHRRRPDSFCRLQDFQVWAQSSAAAKTLVYRHRPGTDPNNLADGGDDFVEMTMDELAEKMKLESEAEDVAGVVFELVDQVERNLRRRQRQEDDKSAASAANKPRSRLLECLTGSSSSSSSLTVRRSARRPATEIIGDKGDPDFLEFALTLGHSA